MTRFTGKKVAYICIRYALIVIVVAAIVFFLAQKTESRTPFEDVASAVKAELNSPKMEENSDRYLKKYFDLNAEDFENVLIYTPLTNMDAEELLLIRLKDTAQTDAVLAAIGARINRQLEIYEGYAPEQVAQLNAGVIDSQGNYIFYMIGDNAEEVDNTFRNALK